MPGAEWSNDPDHSSHAGAGRDRAGRWKKRYRLLSPALPRKTSRRPILRLCGYFSKPQWNRHSPSHLRWARILASAKTALQGAFSLVAGSRPTRQETGSLRSTTSARGRRCVASARRTDVEAGGWTKLGNPEVGEGPYVPKRVAAYSRTNGGA